MRQSGLFRDMIQGTGIGDQGERRRKEAEREKQTD